MFHAFATIILMLRIRRRSIYAIFRDLSPPWYSQILPALYCSITGISWEYFFDTPWTWLALEAKNRRIQGGGQTNIPVAPNDVLIWLQWNKIWETTISFWIAEPRKKWCYRIRFSCFGDEIWCINLLNYP